MCGPCYPTQEESTQRRVFLSQNMTRPETSGENLFREAVFQRTPNRSYKMQQQGQLLQATIPHTFWFWLPSSTDLISIDTMTGAVARTKTGLPSIKDHAIWPLQMGREGSRSLVATFGMKTNSAAAKPQLAYYVWSPEHNEWPEFSPGECKGSWLIWGPR